MNRELPSFKIELDELLEGASPDDAEALSRLALAAALNQAAVIADRVNRGSPCTMHVPCGGYMVYVPPGRDPVQELHRGAEILSLVLSSPPKEEQH